METSLSVRACTANHALMVLVLLPSPPESGLNTGLWAAALVSAATGEKRRCTSQFASRFPLLAAGSVQTRITASLTAHIT